MRFILLVFSVFLIAAPAFAEAPPVPPSKKSSIGNLEQRLQEQERRKKALEKKVRAAEGDLEKTKDRLIDIAKSIQSNEKELQVLENRISELEDEQDEVRKALQQDRQSISRLILALERIRRVPPEALIAKPGAPLKTAQSAMLMRDIIPALNHQAEMLRANLESLDKISIDLNTKREKALTTATDLSAEHAKLAGLVNKREKLYSTTRGDLKEQEKNVKKISAQARNLQDLVRKLDNERREKARIQAQKAVLSTAVPIPGAGSVQLPVSGVIRTSYNQPDNFGAPSKGLTIEGRNGALVVAPMGGIVRFAGHFKNYGNMVILEHEKGYHSLIAGLEKIDTVVGHSVSAGEPLGLLQQASAPAQKATLYYELRHNGQPINPSRKFAGLG